MKNSTYSDQDIGKMQDDILGLKITVHLLIELLAQTSDTNREQLLKNFGLAANNLESACPDFPATAEVLDDYFRQVADMHRNRT